MSQMLVEEQMEEKEEAANAAVTIRAKRILLFGERLLFPGFYDFYRPKRIGMLRVL